MTQVKEIITVTGGTFYLDRYFRTGPSMQPMSADQLRWQYLHQNRQFAFAYYDPAPPDDERCMSCGDWPAEDYDVSEGGPARYCERC